MNNQIKKLKMLIDKYHKFIEKEDFDAIEKLCEDGDIYFACEKIAKKIPSCKIFEGKGFDSPGYDLTSYVFVWIDNKEIDGIVLNWESL